MKLVREMKQIHSNRLLKTRQNSLNKCRKCSRFFLTIPQTMQKNLAQKYPRLRISKNCLNLKILIAARDCCNLVRTFGDDELKETFAKMELTKLPSLISEVQHHIDNINQKELLQVMKPQSCLSMKQWRILLLISAKSVRKN